MSNAPTDEELVDGFHSTTALVTKEHNQKPTLESPDDKRRLRSIVERIIRLEEEKKGLSSDIKDIYTEAASAGYAAKAIRINVKRLMEDDTQRQKRQAIQEEADLIEVALGDFVTSPLGAAALDRGRH